MIKKNLFEESWDVYKKSIDYQNFLDNTMPPSQDIQSDFRSICIADAAFRLSTAGVLISEIIRNIDLEGEVFVQNNWPYQRFLKKNKSLPDWDRNTMIQDSKTQKCVEIEERNHCYLALITSLRDEYGHSEFNDEKKCRSQIREKYYEKHIINAEFEMLQNCLAIIRYLCEAYPEKLEKA